MSTSLKVVSIAVSFFTATNLLATVFLKEDIFSERVALLPGAMIAAADFASERFAACASSFVILPSLPEPFIACASIPFSDKILAAAGEG